MKKVVSLALSIIMIICTLGISTTAYATDDEASTVNITVKYCQTNARTMLDMVNEFRTGNDAWVWDSTNSQKVSYTDLTALTYDYDLEKAAMQRAAEIAISYSHTRPNGTSCFTSYTGYARGENIAAGYTTVQAVFDGWKEDNEYYSGQGHRRNMLSKNYTAMAVACVYYNGYYYWVQEFRNPVENATETTANDSKTNVDIDILNSNLTNVTINKSTENISLNCGETADLPSLTASIATSESWPTNKCPVNINYSWEVANTAVAKITENKITVVNGGTTNIETTVLGQTVTIPITANHNYSKNVTPATTKADGVKTYTCSVCGDTNTSKIAKISSATLSTTSYTYNGSAKKPTVTVKDSKGNKIASSNYTVKYTNNKNVGKATVKITFKGNYSGTITKTFKINPKATTISKLTATSKGFKATWKKQSTQTTGYQIRYSTKSNMSGAKTVTVKKNSTTSTTVKKLTSKKKYYVQIRTYKTVNGTKYYSTWSKAKTVTTKK